MLTIEKLIHIFNHTLVHNTLRTLSVQIVSVFIVTNDDMRVSKLG